MRQKINFMIIFCVFIALSMFSADNKVNAYSIDTKANTLRNAAFKNFVVYSSLEEAQKVDSGSLKQFESWKDVCDYLDDKSSGSYYVRIIGENGVAYINSKMTINSGVTVHVYCEEDKMLKLNKDCPNYGFEVEGTLCIGAYGSNKGINKDGSTLKITETSTRSGKGSVINVVGGKVYTYEEVTFFNISSECSGTAIAMRGSSSTVKISGSTFSKLNATGIEDNGNVNCGGAIYISSETSKCTLVLDHVTIQNCTAKGHGGGIYCGNKTSTISIKNDTVISSCEAGDAGGAIATMSNINLYECSIHGNTALGTTNVDLIQNGSYEADEAKFYGVGGGVYCRFGKVTLDSLECKIYSNKALSTSSTYLTGRGGNLCISSEASLCFENGYVYGGMAGQEGGGIYGSTTSNLYIKGGSICNNKAVGNGGGVLTYGKLTITGGTIGGSLVNANTSGKSGGGIRCSGIVNISGGTISFNKAVTGAGISFYAGESSSRLTINDGTISHNTAETYGGGIYLGYKDTASKCYIKGGNIFSNDVTGTADTNGGGGICVITNDELHITGGSIHDNTAYCGGGIRNYGTLNLSGGTILSNEGSHGGGIYNGTNRTVNQTGGIIRNNTSILRIGSGVYNNSIYYRMSGAATVDENNDFYLAKGKYITVNGALKASSGAVAKISMASSDRTLGRIVVKSAYVGGSGRSALYYNYNDNTKRFILGFTKTSTNKTAILRDGVGVNKNISNMKDEDVFISTTYAVDYHSNLDNVQVTVPSSQTKFWNETVMLHLNTATVSDINFQGTYIFQFWSTGSDDDQAVRITITNYDVDEDIDLFAHWLTKFNVKYNGNGAKMSSGKSAYIQADISNNDNYEFLENKFGEETNDHNYIKVEIDKETGEKIKSSYQGWSPDAKAIVYHSCYEKASTRYFLSINDLHEQDVDTGITIENLFEPGEIVTSDTLLNGKFEVSVNEDGLTVQVYAVWDEFPSIQADNIFISLEKVQEGLSSSDILNMSNALAEDKEDPTSFINREDHFIVADYNEEELKQFSGSGSALVTLQVTDSVGNITTKTITVYIVDSKTQEILTTKNLRFISPRYYQESYNDGGLLDNSIWIKDVEYRALIESVMQRVSAIENDTRMVSLGMGYCKTVQNTENHSDYCVQQWTFSTEDREAIQDYVSTHGLGNISEETGLSGFLTKFSYCRKK